MFLHHKLGLFKYVIHCMSIELASFVILSILLNSFKNTLMEFCHFLCSSMCLIPGQAQWIRDLALLQLWYRLQLRLAGLHSIPGPGIAKCCGCGKKKIKK